MKPSPPCRGLTWCFGVKRQLSSETHLHLKLKVLVLALSPQNVTRNANFNGLLHAAVARPDGSGHQVLQRGGGGPNQNRQEEKQKEEENKKLAQNQRSSELKVK